MSIDLSNLSAEQLKRALEIKEQIAALEDELNAIGGEEGASTPSYMTEGGGGAGRGSGRHGGKRTMSPEAKARIAAAQKARWAKQKGETDSGTAKGKEEAKEAKPKNRKMSAEGRARIIAATKARWAKIRGEKANGAVKTEAKPKAESKEAGKRLMSEAAKAKIAAVARKRWKQAKKAGKSKL